jgi:hypothetical protein
MVPPFYHVPSLLQAGYIYNSNNSNNSNNSIFPLPRYNESMVPYPRFNETTEYDYDFGFAADDNMNVSKFSEQTPSLGANRRLLLSLDCFLLVNLKDRLIDVGTILTEYYGSTDGYLKHSMCSYEKFLLDPFLADTEESDDACPREGQTKFMSTFSDFAVLPGLAQASNVLVSPASGIVDSMDEFFAKPRDVMIRDMVAFASSWDTSSITCDTDCLLCKKKKRSLLSSIWIVESWIFILLGALALVGIPIFASFFTAQFAIAPMMTLYLTYGFPVTCLPYVPVCLGDDMFDLLLLIFPRHLSWPSNIVTDATRESSVEFPWLHTLSAEMVDCGTVGVNGFFDVFYWSRHYFAESGYVVYDWFWQLVEWPLLRFGPGVRETRVRWQEVELTPTVNECAALNGISIVPPLIISLFFYTIVSFAAVPMTRVSVQVFQQLLPMLSSFISVALDIYNK